MERVGSDAPGPAFDADRPHAESTGHAGHLSTDRSHAHDHDATTREVGAGVALPMVPGLVLEGFEKALPERKHGHEAEFRQRDRVHAACRGEDRLRHALRVAQAMHELSDAGARSLDPTHAGSALRQVVEVSAIEIEEDLRLRQVSEPRLFVRGGPLERHARVVSGVAGGCQEVRLVGHLDVGVDLPDALYVTRLEEAGDDEAHVISREVTAGPKGWPPKEDRRPVEECERPGRRSISDRRPVRPVVGPTQRISRLVATARAWGPVWHAALGCLARHESR